MNTNDDYIYLVIEEFSDLEDHFEFNHIFLSKEELILNFTKIKNEIGKDYISVYRTNRSCSYNELEIVDLKQLLGEVAQKDEYNLYLKLKAKFEK